MIKASLEAKSFRIWVFCICVFILGVLVCLPFLGLLTEDILYSALPGLDLGLRLSGGGLPSWLTENFNFIVSLTVIGLFVCLAAVTVTLAVTLLLYSQRKRAAGVLKRTGYSQEYFDLIERKRRRLSRSPLAPTNDLCAVSEYIDGRRYESAFQILRNINVDDFDIRDATVYYSLYAYCFILTGDLKNARFALELGDPFVEKQKGSTNADFVRALLMYAEHDFEGAKRGFRSVIDGKNHRLRVWSGMYLALIHLRQHDKDKARKLAVKLSSMKKTPRQSEDMLKLLKKIEQAYTLEAEEAAQAAREEFVGTGV